MRIWSWAKLSFAGIWGWIKWLVEKIWKPLCLLIILFMVWYGFLKLVSPPPLDTSPALVMVWASGAVLILALYPNILERIKGFKIGDFEIEFQDAVQKSATDNFISLSSLDFDSNLFLTQKGSLNSLQQILSRAILERNKPVLLVANLSGDAGERRISIPMLFVYLYLIDIFSRSPIVLFVSSTRRPDRLQSLSGIRKNEVLGLISGNVAIRQLYQQFPNLLQLWAQQGFSRGSRNQNDVYDEDGFLRIPSIGFIDNMYERVRDLISNDSDESEYLTSRKVRQWFGDYLNYRVITMASSQDDLKSIREILSKGDEYFLIVEDNKVSNIVITCNLAKNLSMKTVDYIIKGT